MTEIGSYKPVELKQFWKKKTTKNKIQEMFNGKGENVVGKHWIIVKMCIF